MLKKMKKKRRQKLLAIALSAGVIVTGFQLESVFAASNKSNQIVEGSKAKEKSETPKLVNAASIDAVIKAMALEEKAELVVGVGMPGFPGGPTLEVAGAVGGTHGIPRLGIPSLLVADGPAGLRIRPIREGESQTYYTTAFPIATSLASTFDTKMAEKVGRAQGNEVKEYGIDIFLAPALNIHRDPLNGRNFEYYSEDPLVAGKITAAVVNGVESNGVGATIKHFAANNQETNRTTIDTIVSERALREIYLRGFETAVKESQPWSVMSSYNKLNGIPASQNGDLLTKILREDWGFGGFVMTDWFAGTDPVEQMKAGNDLIMPGFPQHSTKIVEAVKNGTLDETILDRNVKKILQIIVESPSFKNFEYSDAPDLEVHTQVARQAAAEGMVLFKNENKALPLKEGAKVGLFGNTQIETIKGGTGSGDVNSAYTISIADGLENAGIQLHQGMYSSYKSYISTLRQMDEYKIKDSPWGADFGKLTPVIPEKPLEAKEIDRAVSESDMGVILIGRNSGESADRKNEKGDYLLTDVEQEMIANVSEKYHTAGKKVAVVLNIGGPVDVASWRDKVDSILLAWQPGQEAGHAVADVLTGAVNPSGKLSTTFPITYSDAPSAENFPGTPKENPTQVVYEEDIYVGYRYYTTFDVNTAYEFGYGLSYTNFKYSNVRVSNNGNFKNKLTVFATVENTGDIAGKEAVQVYVSAPDGKLEKPEVELKAFAKTKELRPGKKENLKFELNTKDLASFNEKLSAWVVEKGTYNVKVGASSENIKGIATFKVDKDIIVEKVNDVLEPKVEIDRLSKFDK
ncbi:glycoside hydrolase family 3 C-terminal domain-containing protein [Metabacillus herbersteinensis]|uniref:Glycoside hydrolase family 3 C-terminal domain-containing protein n=1 Tax=Metabacillus herbersteinensis TaxID=283816 RepID=A0ABV6GFU6_9BACI